jgi:adenosine deaminase
MFAELAQRNAGANVQYLELMLSPDIFASLGYGLKAEWNDDFGKMRAAMLDGGLREIVAQTRKNLDQWEARRDEILHCRDANKTRVEPGCGVKTRYIFQILRGFPKQAVFSQLVTAFETASQDPRVVALNLVMPEDTYIPMHDFDLHMRSTGWLALAHSRLDRDRARRADRARCGCDVRRRSAQPAGRDGQAGHHGRDLPDFE